jgi:hypothetical protein
VIITFFGWGLDDLVWEEGKGESKVVVVLCIFYLVLEMLMVKK